jgi:hypothetical protein
MCASIKSAPIKSAPQPIDVGGAASRTERVKIEAHLI